MRALTSSALCCALVLTLAPMPALLAAESPRTALHATRLDAEQALAFALQQANLGLIEQATRAQALAELDQARRLPNPQLRWEQERGRGALDGSREWSWMLSQTWDLGGSRGLLRSAAEQRIAEAEAGLAARRAALRLEVLQRFHATIAAESRRAAAARRALALAELESIAQRRTQAGDLAGYEARRLALSAREARILAEARAAEVLAAREALAALVGPVAIGAGLDASPLTASDTDTQLANASVDAHPELEALRRTLETALAAATAAQRWRVPVEFGLGRKQIDTPASAEHALLLEVALPLPLFDRNQADAARRRSEADLARAELLTAQRRLAAERAALQADARQRVESALAYRDELVPEARALGEIAARSFSAGELDVVGLLEALSAEAAVNDEAANLDFQARVALLGLSAFSHHPGDAR
jgi:outer membrane protein, heavy metal efflux system